MCVCVRSTEYGYPVLNTTAKREQSWRVLWWGGLQGANLPGIPLAQKTWDDRAGGSGPTGGVGEEKTRLNFSATIQCRRDNPCALLDVLSRCNLTALCLCSCRPRTIESPDNVNINTDTHAISQPRCALSRPSRRGWGAGGERVNNTSCQMLEWHHASADRIVDVEPGHY
ncbi:hypothetical protein LX36DRAFT_649390 [Colletotrichum falcatum]|nr:hypothetical protein LX36DRAFT_649390 [Colletotrichum falcatum]